MATKQSKDSALPQLTWVKVRKIVTRYFVEARWYTIVLALIFYGISSWWLLDLSGETALLEPADFIYWLAVTGSTVGYGDMSPSTPMGKTIVAFYIIPFGLTLFALAVGRVAAWVSEQWRRGVKGLNSVELNDHLLVIGWNENRTQHLLKLLLKERAESADKPEIMLCVRVDIENPLPGEIEFIKVNSFNKDDDMDRASVARARTILIDNPQDDMTLATALYCAKRNDSAHVVAYFQDDSLADLLKTHCPNVECTPSVAVEMLAKSAFDPGSSVLHHDLISVEEGQAQYSVALPLTVNARSVEQVFNSLKKHYDATFIGFAPGTNATAIKVNPPMDEVISPGDKLFYISDHRINDLNWALLE
ncbi:potassium channel family protein [Aestuariibacter salexigens]|uniref:potassium channel family protein n=1 Tax=Aestuariibacter salexigens TaxID=226010 RepID=UPI0004128191|nr:potassium channel family protein [Aestuariibacter salexigens]